MKAANAQTNALSYPELLEQERQLIENIEKINVQIDDYQNRERLAKKSSTNTDDLDDFMINLSKDKQLDKIEIRRMRIELQTLKNDHLRLQKLINIARPIDLPPLKLDNEINANKLMEKPKKFNLPLFGKRGGAFKFGTSSSVAAAAVVIPKKTVSVETTVTTTLSSSSLTSKDYKSDEEEIEEHEELSTTNNVNEQKECEIEEKVNSIKKNLSSSPSSSTNSNEPNAEETNEIDDIAIKAMAAAAAKKRRNRVRIRGDRYRDNVDIDDSIEHKDVEKYSTWVPPDNQSGDGSTNLNKKYGY